MDTTIFESRPKAPNDSLIKNSIIERMFLSICTTEQMQIYQEKANSDTPAIRASATAYASTKVERIFMYWRDEAIKNGTDLDYLNWKLWRK